MGCSPWGPQELDTTERLHFHFSLSCIGEGNGNPLQCSCLENPMDGGAWWAAVHGVPRSWTRLSDFTFTFMHWRRKCQPTPVFLPGESQGRRSLVGCRRWGRIESDMTEATSSFLPFQNEFRFSGWGSSVQSLGGIPKSRLLCL